MAERHMQYNPVYPDAIIPVPVADCVPTDARPNAEDYATAAAASEVRRRAGQLASGLGSLSVEPPVASRKD